MKENEAVLKETKNQIKEKQTQVIQLDTEFQTVQFKSDQASTTKKYSLKKTMDLLKKEVNELRCIEQKMSRQNEMISGPLSDLGCEVPTGCDVSSNSNNNLETIVNSNETDTQSQSSLGKNKKSAQVMSMLRKPFSKSRASPVLSGRQGVGGDDIDQGNAVSIEEKNLEDELWFHGVLPRE